MAGRSSIERLPLAILAAVHEAIVEGATIDEIVRRIRERGGTCSRSAVVRYVKRARARLRRWREDKALADVRPDTPGARGEGGTGPLTLETLRSLAMRAAIALDDREEPPTVDQIAALALALQRIQGASRNGADRENAAGREDVGRKETAQGDGLSPEIVARIRAAVEGSWAGRPGPVRRKPVGPLVSDRLGPVWAGIGRNRPHEKLFRAPGGRPPPTDDAAARWRRNRASTSIRAGPPGEAGPSGAMESRRGGQDGRPPPSNPPTWKSRRQSHPGQPTNPLLGE